MPLVSSCFKFFQISQIYPFLACSDSCDALSTSKPVTNQPITNHQLIKMIFILCNLIVVLLVFFLIRGIIYALNRAYLILQIGELQQKKMLRLVFLCFMLWLIITAILAVMGYYSNFNSFPPRILLLGLLPPVILIIGLLFSKNFTKILQTIPPDWLIKVQSFRIIMELMLWLAFIDELLPFQMTFEGFNADIIAGVTALFAASVFFRNGRFLKPEIIIWNVFGILLLINIVFITLISTPSPYRIFLNEPSSAIIATFPFIWIPTFIVPYALAMHLFSIRQIFILNGEW